ncbi:MAG: class I adenylate-forming enzyme family protein [Dehalococcoidales bacterium]
MNSIYEERPWLNLYPKGTPSDLEITNKTAIDIFEDTASKLSQAPAIHYFDDTITYGQLNSLADSLAAALSDLGLSRGDRIVLSLQNVPQFLISQYAAWKLGAIVVPLNPMYKEKELEYYLNDSGAKIIVCMESTTYEPVKKAIAKAPVKQVITTSEIDFLPQGQPPPKLLRDFQKRKTPGTLDFLELINKYRGNTARRAKVNPSDVAHLLYTSGTTGPPKGAMNTHGNVVFAAECYKAFCHLGTSDVVLGAAPLFHVTGTVGHLAITSLIGAPLVIFYRFDPAEVLRLIEKWRVTNTVAAITAFIALLDHPDFHQRDLSSLKKVYSGGAPVPAGFVDRFEQSSGIYIHHAYGLTETTSPGLFPPWGLRAPIDPESGALSTGFPLPSSCAKIVDAEEGTREIPPGELGEIIIKGPTIVPGYWGKPEETAHAIRDGWLYTGDIGKMDKDGWFYVVDRKKDLINVSGFKVWPREVEDILYQHPAVKEAAVVGVPDAYRGETVKAFVSLREEYEGKISPPELIDFCRQKMAAYKYPRVVEFIPEVPKTLTGKFMRRVLREQELKRKIR